MPSSKQTAKAAVGRNDQILRLKLSLVDSKPRIWRRVEVPAGFTLGDLHYVIQIAMGWEDYHLHVFEVDERRFSIPMEDFEDSGDAGADTVTLADLGLNRAGRSFTYVYDFGDDWVHHIEVEAVSAPRHQIRYPRCTQAVRACPPEDSGGMHGYMQMLRVLRKPEHPDYEEMVEWIGEDFDPEAVDVEEINADLREAFAG